MNSYYYNYNLKLDDQNKAFISLIRLPPPLLSDCIKIMNAELAPTVEIPPRRWAVQVGFFSRHLRYERLARFLGILFANIKSTVLSALLTIKDHY